MECNWKIKSDIPANNNEERLKKVICKKIARVIVNQENKNRTFHKKK